MPFTELWLSNNNKKWLERLTEDLKQFSNAPYYYTVSKKENDQHGDTYNLVITSYVLFKIFFKYCSFFCKIVS